MLHKIFTHVLIASVRSEKKPQITKSYTPSDSPAHGQYENLCFISVLQGTGELQALV